MNAEVMSALEKAAKKAGHRDELSQGEYDVDAIVRVVGTLKVGTDYEATPTVSIPLKETLALFVHRCGCTRDKALEVLADCMRDAIGATNRGAGALVEALPEVSATMSTVQHEVLAKLPKAKKRGAVRFNGEVSVEETCTVCR